MKTTFQGKYYTGKSSVPYPCEVMLGRHFVSVHITDESGNVTKFIDWELESIEKDNAGIGDKMRLKYGSFPCQTIEVKDNEFSRSLSELYPSQSFTKRDKVSIISREWRIVIGILLFLVGFVMLTFKVIIPSLAEYTATKVPLSAEQAIGDAAYKQIGTTTTEDTEKSRLVQEFSDAMGLKHSYDYSISVLKSDEVNAFAVPGGKIAVYSGIIDQMDKPEELAALLAHESSHIELKHSLRSIFRSLSGYLVLSLFGDVSGITAIVFENLNVFQDLQYSRGMEKEADTRGLECMQEAGINPQGMIELFNTLESSAPDSTDSHNLSEFASTHPQTKHRIQYIRELISKDKNTYSNNAELDSLFQLIKN